MSCHHHQIDDIETIHQKFRGIIEHQDAFFEEIAVEQEEAVEKFLEEVLVGGRDVVGDCKRKYGLHFKNSTLLRYARGRGIGMENGLEEVLRISRGKSHSGVLVITVFTSAYPEYVTREGKKMRQSFSCKWNCHYCPNQPGQPRSYLEGEPGVLRANTNEFDCCRQMWSRMEALYNTGHPVDKLEVLVLGGTWESYPEEYRDDFIRDIYYAANVFWQRGEKRVKGSLGVERDGNRYGECKVIGVTLETRPDTICIHLDSIVNSEIPPPVIKKLRSYGCTRVQMGIQHLDDGVLKLINRGCDTETAVAAILLLKEWGYKIDAHWMPNLPGCSPELDRWMFLEMLLKERRAAVMRTSLVEGVDEWKVWFLEHPELQVDQWKIYPCEVVPYTEIEKWYREGKWAPYGQEALSEVLMETKRAVFPWIRLNRVVRDIPSDYIMASGDHPSLRQELLLKMKKRGWECKCIRCREIKGREMPSEVKYRVHEYGGEEYFVECVGVSGLGGKEVLCGFLRLRLGRRGIAWIRELHVYGQIVKTTGAGRVPVVQSQGIGRRLVEIGERISRLYGYGKVWVIAGEGTKCYYERLGFREGDWGYMVKELS
jgi:histone acetyltransferase (RNA polymerase elongator complex component)